MCGIVGYVGKSAALAPVLDGLSALEYRGYDSAGIAAINGGQPVCVKQVGRVDALGYQLQKSKIYSESKIAIGHTRWATHGAPTIKNAHPHFNGSQTIFAVHNGIIENWQELKTRLQKASYKFVSDTDTEVIPHLIEWHLAKNKNDFYKAFKAAVKELKGAYAIAALWAENPQTLYAARLSSPLVIGVGQDGHFLASDPSAIMAHTKKVVFLDDWEIAEISAKNLNIHSIKHSVDVERHAEELDYDHQQASLAGYPHFMLKEIFEAPATIQAASLGRVKAGSNVVKLGGLESVAEQLRFIDRLVIVACGTSYYAGLVGEYLIEELAGIPVEVQLASEFKYRQEPFSRSTALLAISQSGETADTIAALQKVADYGVLRLGVVNAVGSTIARLTDAGVYCHAGPEQSVASTKAFIAQVTVLAQIAFHLSRQPSKIHKPLMSGIIELPALAQQVLKLSDQIQKMAVKYSDNRDFLFIGRGYLYPVALEGALKLKEISYIHAEGYAAGEMKHGPLAMIDGQFPTFALALDSPLLEKTLSNMQEIKARGGPIIALATAGNHSVAKVADDVIYLPNVIEQLQPILAAIATQLFAYHVAVHKKLDVDRPRNLAKSVTVE